MANNWPAVEQDLQRAIDAAWPEANLTFFAGDLDKMDWEELSRVKGQAGTIQLVAPWAVVLTSEWTISVEYGPMDADYLEGPVSVFYVVRDQDHIDPATNQANPVGAIAERLSAMQEYLESNTLSVVQLPPDGYRPDWGPSNPLNRRLSEQKLPMTAGSLTFRAVIPGPQIDCTARLAAFGAEGTS